MVLGETAIGDPGDHAHRPEGVLVHGVGMVHVELHLGDDAAPFGQVPAKDVGLIHQGQGPLRVAAVGEDIEHDRSRCRVPAHPRPDQGEVTRGRGEGVGMQVKAFAVGVQEQAQEIGRIGLKDLGPLHMQAATLGVETWCHGPPARTAPARQEARQGCRLRLDPVFLELGSKDPRQDPDFLGDQEVASHESLYRGGVAPVTIAHPPGDGRLQVEGQPLLRPAGREVHVAAYGPQEVDGADESGDLPAVEHVQLDDTAGPVGAGDGIQVAGDPEQGVEVAQAALALLDVGLDHVAADARTDVPFVPFLELGGDELGAGAPHHLIAEPAEQVPRQGLVAGQVPGLEDGGADREILAGEPQALVHGARGVADLEAQIPQGVEHEFDHALGVRRLLVGPQEEEIEVGEGRQGPAPVAAHGHQGQALALRGIARPEDVDRREVVEGADHLVGNARKQPGRLNPAGAVLQTLLGDHPPPEEGLAEDLERTAPLLPLVPEGVERRRRQASAQADPVQDVFDAGRAQTLRHQAQI